MSADLIVDPQIRSWVFLPIVVITFLVGILRHYISLLINSQKKLDRQQLKDSQLLIRARLLRENAKFIPKTSFLIRKQAFNREEDGYLTQRRPLSTQNIITDPSIMTDMLKGNLTNVLPMIVIGGWINWMFSGFITTADQSQQMEDQMSGAAIVMPNDTKTPLKAEWEALEIFEHKWALEGIEKAFSQKKKIN